jgi:BolA family transcriptional regulator, general stress-responsive regulator
LNVPAANPQRMARMRELLEAAFAPAALDVIDDSHRHVGHAGARGGHGHFTVDIVSDRFDGMPQVARHRAVYDALGAMLSTDIHALSIRAATPAERS